MYPKKILILWGHLTSYILSSIESLNRTLEYQCEIVVVSETANSDYPSLLDSRNLHNVQFVDYNNFQPNNFSGFELLLVSSWNYRKYRLAARINQDSCAVMSMDNQYLATMKQKVFLHSKIGPKYIRYLFDYVFVAGSRQVEYARRIGFDSKQISVGVYAYDDELFNYSDQLIKRNQFCFIGRKIHIKGLFYLLKAYEIYRVRCHNQSIVPFELIIAGPGTLLREPPHGVRDIGYVTPKQAAELMAESRCLVLPSVFEPFGVVLTEAAASRCLLIASDSSGASDELIREGLNGFKVASKDYRQLATAMMQITQLTPNQVLAGQKISQSNAQNFRPEIWTKKILSLFAKKLSSQT